MKLFVKIFSIFGSMRIFSYIQILVIILSTITPCHAGTHEHGTPKDNVCHNHHHDKSENEQDSEDHPCSPFCLSHNAFYFDSINIAFPQREVTEAKEKPFFTYVFPYYSTCIFNIWNPPKK